MRRRCWSRAISDDGREDLKSSKAAIAEHDAALDKTARKACVSSEPANSTLLTPFRAQYHKFATASPWRSTAAVCAAARKGLPPSRSRQRRHSRGSAACSACDVIGSGRGQLMCDNLWIAASTNRTGAEPLCSGAGRTVRNKVIAGDGSDAAKTEGEQFSDNLWMTGV